MQSMTTKPLTIQLPPNTTSIEIIHHPETNTDYEHYIATFKQGSSTVPNKAGIGFTLTEALKELLIKDQDHG